MVISIYENPGQQNAVKIAWNDIKYETFSSSNSVIASNKTSRLIWIFPEYSSTLSKTNLLILLLKMRPISGCTTKIPVCISVSILILAVSLILLKTVLTRQLFDTVIFSRYKL